MDNKKTFGMFILQRRRELGLTQKEFAAKLFVTESAVSKWERGMSYPDITLLQNICAVLEVSEHELLSGSEDTRQRDSYRLAERYIKLCRNTRLSQYIIYGGILLACAMGNLLSSGRLDWFFIILPSVLMCASLTLTPSLCALNGRLEPYRRLISLGRFSLSLELLLLACCLYVGGNWFGWAGMAVLFGLSLVCLPFILRSPLLPEKFRRCKLSLYLAAETLMLLLLLLVCSFYTGGSWFLITACALLFGLGLLFLPVFLRQLPLPRSLGSRKFSLYVGIETASISAVIASIGVGISLAVQGTLSNFAGGVIIIVMRPFKIGDYITSNDQSGTVEDIKLFYTHIVTPDNKGVVIPNGQLANNVIVNASAKDTRRVDLVVSVAYGSDVELVKRLIKEVCAANELIFTDPAPFTEMSAMSESSLDFTVRVWCNRGDYWTVYFALLSSILNTLNENGIEIPFNQLDVNLKSLPEKAQTAVDDVEKTEQIKEM